MLLNITIMITYNYFNHSNTQNHYKLKYSYLFNFIKI